MPRGGIFLLHFPGPSATAEPVPRPLRTVGVTHHRILWSPDFPPPGEPGDDRPANPRTSRYSTHPPRFCLAAGPALLAGGGEIKIRLANFVPISDKLRSASHGRPPGIESLCAIVAGRRRPGTATHHSGIARRPQKRQRPGCRTGSGGRQRLAPPGSVAHRRAWCRTANRGGLSFISLHPDIFQPAEKTAANDHLNLGCCRLEIPKDDKAGAEEAH